MSQALSVGSHLVQPILGNDPFFIKLADFSSKDKTCQVPFKTIPKRLPKQARIRLKKKKKLKKQGSKLTAENTHD